MSKINTFTNTIARHNNRLKPMKRTSGRRIGSFNIPGTISRASTCNPDVLHPRLSCGWNRDDGTCGHTPSTQAHLHFDLAEFEVADA